jgi:hypothetical protein
VPSCLASSRHRNTASRPLFSSSPCRNWRSHC